jgi:hypothetical protein
MIQLEVLVEEPSAEEAMRHVLPKVLGQRASFRIINLGSKYKLLKVLGERLAAYRQRIDNGESLRVVVLVDLDDDDCLRLKKDLEEKAAGAGLHTKTRPDSAGHFLVINRIVVEELESWFIGDPTALRKAFPKLPAINEKTKLFRNPDNGGSWKALHGFLKKHGIYKKHYPKIEAARRIAPHMDVSGNRSRSFHVFLKGLEAALQS